MTLTRRQVILSILAVFVMFLPRNLSIAGMFSFRIFIIGAALIAFWVFGLGIRLTGIIRMPTFWLYIGAVSATMISHGQYTTMLGTLVDILVLYIVLNSCLKTKDDMDFFVRLFLIILTIYCIFCLIETLTGFSPWTLLNVAVKSYKRYGVYRSVGAFTTSINNGVFLLLTFPMIWYAQKRFFRKLFIIAATIGVWVALICTLSRGPILFALILHVIVIWRAGILRFIRRNYLLIILAVFLFILAIQIVPSIMNTLRSLLNMFVSVFDANVAEEITDEFGTNAEGVGQRFQLYEWVWEEVKGHRWFGVGANMPLNHLWKPDPYHIVVKQSIENFYLATLFHYGVVGLACLVSFLLETLFRIFKRYRNEKKIYHLKKAGSSLQFRIFITFICYFGTLFTVSATDDFKMFIILAAFSEAYQRIYVSRLYVSHPAVSGAFPTVMAAAN